MRTLNLKSYSDSQHGWLAVPRKLVDELGVVASPYSYEKGKTVYLEEDGDLSEFMDKAKAAGYIINMTHKNTEYSPIRSYPRFIKNKA